MLVFGDNAISQDTPLKLAGIADGLSIVATMAPGIARHAALVGELIEVGELLQGIADSRFKAAGQDSDATILAEEWSLLMGLAKAVRVSWQSSFSRMSVLPGVALGDRLPDRIICKKAEGFAFYSLYPESYLVAGEVSGLDGSTRIIGLRSIGVVLAAMVATAVGAPAPLTLRPVGHPFRREYAVPDACLESLLRAGGDVAIVDEGPGLSGSSMGGVADRLEAVGVGPARLHFFPSHAGSVGTEALPSHRARWERARRHVVDFETLALSPVNPAHRLTGWVADLTGPAVSGIRDIGAGAWRGLRYRDESRWPPVHRQQERRKYLQESNGQTWLLKFAGIGREGMRKAAMAQVLSKAGFIPGIAGWRHGFLVQEWIGNAADVPDCRDAIELRRALARYLAFRAERFPADAAAGASLQALWNMACHNTQQALGEPMARKLRSRQPDLSTIRIWHRCATDNRMQAWKWLALPDGRMLKADAVDHYAAHDLIGCQDVAWDLVGAQIELGIGIETLCDALEAESGRAVDTGLIAAYTPCYLAFQLGVTVLAAQASIAWPQEVERLEQQSARYASMLRTFVATGRLELEKIIPGRSPRQVAG